MRFSSFLTAGLIWAMTGAAALAESGKWEWTPSPEEGSGERSCWMFIRVGEAQLMISGSTESRFIGVGAAELAGLETGEEGTLRFAETIGYQLNFLGGGDDDYGSYIAKITEEGLRKVLDVAWLLNPADNIFVSVGSSGVLTFPATGAKEAAEGVSDCLKQL